MPQESEKPTADRVATRGLDLPTGPNNWGFKGKNYLFVIGIDKYQHWPPLKCAVKDVQDFVAILTKRYQFEEEDVITVLDENATVRNILIAFKKLAKKITDQDNVIIYFSGHGHYDATKTGYWIPVEALTEEDSEYQYINTAIVVDRLRTINSLHTFLIVDACFSGTLIAERRAISRDEQFKSRRVFTSGRAEVVSDGPAGGNSPFARGILNELTHAVNQDLSASQLIENVKEYVQKEAQQTPDDARLMNIDDQGGTFVFHSKISEVEIWDNVVGQHTKEAYARFIERFPHSERLAEAREAYDWLIAYGKFTISSLLSYYKAHQPNGKYVSLARQIIGTIEEEDCWVETTQKGTLAAYLNYLATYPEGKHAQEANEQVDLMSKDEDDVAWENAIRGNAVEGYEQYLSISDKKKYESTARKKIEELKKEHEIRKEEERRKEEELKNREFTQTQELSNEKKAWANARESGLYTLYRDFTQLFPESQLVDQARREMTRLDDVALNKVRIAEHSSQVPLRDKISQCEAYFKHFPNAFNNAKVREIKDRLMAQRPGERP